jgi:hypothetical protein
MTDPGTRAGAGTSEGAARGAAPGSRTQAAAVVQYALLAGPLLSMVDTR